MEMGLNTNSDSDAALSIESALKQLTALERMIEITSTRLVDLRGLSLNEFNIKEIRTLEGKLIKHFCQQLDTKLRIPSSDVDIPEYPSLSKWLNVVGVSSLLAKGLQMQCRSVEDLLNLTDKQLQNVISEIGGNAEDDRKLISSLKQLKQFQSLQRQNRKNIDTTQVYWDSFSKADDVFGGTDSTDHNENVKSEKKCFENGVHDQSGSTSRHGSESSDSLPLDQQQKLHRTRSNTDPSNADIPNQFTELPSRHRSYQLPSTSSSCLTPPSPSGLGSRSSLESDSGFSVTKPAPSASPPPIRSKIFVIPPSPLPVYTPPVTPGTPHKNSHFHVQNSGSRSLTRERVSSTGNTNSTTRSAKAVSSTALLPPFTPLKPSKSSEWHIGNRIFHNDSISASNQSLSSIASSTSHKHKPSKKEKKRPHNLVLTNDDNIPLFNYIHYSKPAASRRSSQTTISPENAASNSAGVSPLSPRTPMTPMTPHNAEMTRMDVSMSLRTPSSPQTPKNSKGRIRAFFGKIWKIKRNKSTEHIADEYPQGHPPLPSNPLRADSLPQNTTTPVVGRDSSYTPDENGGMFQASYGHGSSSSAHSGDTSSMTSLSRPVSLVDTDRTLISDVPADEGSLTNTITRADSEIYVEQEEESTLTERDVVEDEKLDTATMRANLFRQGSTIQSMSEEWDIPYSELQIGDKIGSGRVGTVFRGRWHGEVAIRVIDINHNDEDKLRAFKQEIMIYKKTRHENLELFMGSCMHPPHLAIVTGLCRGQSLYNHIRSSRYQTLNINHAKIIGQHIVQGMGYLHSKGIIHKDLKSKNIFVDGKHVVLTDFGIVGLHVVSGDKNSRPGSLSIPDGWLCHLAPEVIKALRVPEYEGDEVISTLPYTIQSDVYAFGTVWYELMSGSWPFNGFPAESIIWQVGSGKKQNLSQMPGGKDIKDILMQAWSYDPSRRPDFSDNGIMGILKRLQSHIHRGNSDPAMICCDPMMSSRTMRRYHPLLSPAAKSKVFDIGSLKF
uniref:Kinase suppressor of Ras 2 n=1 Tax=Phallusia mammillata TaxID=59560 RepID=A0A6F9DGT0_9ASCI|nr:kinase suppressor of Ras 2 [Phallusia mammillata]